MGIGIFIIIQQSPPSPPSPLPPPPPPLMSQLTGWVLKPVLVDERCISCITCTRCVHQGSSVLQRSNKKKAVGAGLVAAEW